MTRLGDFFLIGLLLEALKLAKNGKIWISICLSKFLHSCLDKQFQNIVVGILWFQKLDVGKYFGYFQKLGDFIPKLLVTLVSLKPNSREDSFDGVSLA